MADSKEMAFTLWDVGHGLSIWINTPNGQNHWIDAGKNNDTDFCPAKHVNENYGVRSLDYLIISHPDSDHLHNLPSVIENLGEPKTLRRNKSLPDSEKYGQGSFEYQKVYKKIDKKYDQTTVWEENPRNPAYNGGVTVKADCLSWRDGLGVNNTSIVVFYSYAGWLFICPGDIEADGWNELWPKNKKEFQPLLNSSDVKILIAPHHGRSSGYCKEMIEAIEPHLILISDKYGKEPTDQRFRDKPVGLPLDGTVTKFLSTKTSGRVQFIINSGGQATYSIV